MKTIILSLGVFAVLSSSAWAEHKLGPGDGVYRDQRAAPVSVPELDPGEIAGGGAVLASILVLLRD